MLTFKKCIDAYIACLSLKDKELPFKFSYAVSRLLRKLEPCFEAFNKEEKKLIEKYAKGEPDRNGSIEFETAEAKVKYLKELDEIKNTDAEIKIEVRTVPAPESIPPSILFALADFIDFEGVS